MIKQEREATRSPKEWSDVNEAAEYIRHSVQFIYNNLDSIPHHKPKGKLLFSREELDLWIRGQWPRKPKIRRTVYNQK